jgi:uncharacterized protein (DUF4415 family)
VFLVPVLDDPYSITITDHESDPTKERFVTLGLDIYGRLLAVVYTYRNEDIRLISARPATPSRARTVQETTMKKEYDFSKGKRGPVLPVPPGKERITIRLDKDILEYFRDQVERACGGNYQTLINDALRAFIEGQRQPTLEETLRRIIREELRKAS